MSPRINRSGPTKTAWRKQPASKLSMSGERGISINFRADPNDPHAVTLWPPTFLSAVCPPGTLVSLEEIPAELRFWPGELVMGRPDLYEGVVPIVGGPYLRLRESEGGVERPYISGDPGDLYYEIRNARDERIAEADERVFFLADDLVPATSTMLVRKFRARGK